MRNNSSGLIKLSITMIIAKVKYSANGILSSITTLIQKLDQSSFLFVENILAVEYLKPDNG
jgi:hypothetical protein